MKHSKQLFAFVRSGFAFVCKKQAFANSDGLCLRCSCGKMVAEIIIYDTRLLQCILHCLFYFREDSGKGVWCSLLVPTAVIVSSFKSSTVGQYGCVFNSF